MRNFHYHESSHLRLFEASMIIGISCLFAVILFLPAQPSAAQEVGYRCHNRLAILMLPVSAAFPSAGSWPDEAGCSRGGPCRE